MSYSVLVCDDDPRFATECVEKIEELDIDEYRVRTEGNDIVRTSTNELLERRRKARDGKNFTLGSCIFDDLDILIIDYDLLYIDKHNTAYTGESVARLVRSFSNCAVVVVLNQFAAVDFDLSLRGHLESHADLNINASQIANPGLWRNPPWQEFRPWSWQTLSKAVESQRTRERAFRDGLNEPIVDIFEMKLEDATRLSDTAFSFISPDIDNFDSLRQQTLKDFLSKTPDGRDVLTGLELSNSSYAVRFGAARIGKWLDREVLGPQDVLIDVPHLLLRFPFLLGDELSDTDAWNHVVHHHQPLKDVINAEYWFEPEDCLSKPAVWGRRLEADDEFSRRREDGVDYSRVPNIVFMEDCSEFADISRGTEFRAGFHNAFDRRFVKQISDVRYGPQRRFAFGT